MAESFAHAEDFVGTIPHARLVDTCADSHRFWLGPARRSVSDAIRGFTGSELRST